MILTDLLFPRLCVGCNKLGSYLCSNCTQSLPQKDLICPICKRNSIGGMTHPLCSKKYGLDGMWSLGAYSGKLRKIIQKLKYRWVSDIAERLVDIMIEYWVLYPPQFLEEINKSNGEGWVIVPVPLHPKRYKWRGFNQSALLGMILAKKIGLNYKEAIVRTKNTQPQVGLEAVVRRDNIKDAFALSPNNQKPAANSYLLIDDVWTTGSTLKECCYVLKKNGAKKVWAITIAR